MTTKEELDELFSHMENCMKQDSDNESQTDINACKSCESYDLVVDYTHGIIVCNACGVVNDHELIDEGAEWNSGFDDAKNPSRCGCPINPLLERSSMSTMIGKGGGQKFWLMRKIHQQNSMDYIERSRWHVFESITRCCEKGNISPKICELAKEYYKSISEKKLSRGGIRKGLIACCIMFACKENNVSRSSKEISIICGVDVSKINHASKLFQELINIDKSTQHTQPNDLIIRFCCCLNLETKEQYKIANQVQIFSDSINEAKILIGKTPSAVTSAMIYIILIQNGHSINKRLLVKQHGISIVTLNKIVTIINNHFNLIQL